MALVVFIWSFLITSVVHDTMANETGEWFLSLAAFASTVILIIPFFYFPLLFFYHILHAYYTLHYNNSANSVETIY